MTITSTRHPRPRLPSGAQRRWRAVAALVAGVSGLVVGVGVGLRWLGAGVVSWISIGAIGALIVGVVLVVLGLRWSTDGMKPGARVAVAIPTVLAVVLLVWTLTPAVVATVVPPTDHGAEFDLAGGEVHFVSADGVDLWGWYVPPPDGKTVVLRHGSGSTASDALRHASVLVANGYGVLITDARGHGRSDGAAMDFGWHGDEDISGAVTFLTRQPEVDDGRIAVVGLSMGGEEALGAMAADQRISAVVAEGATARTEADKVWLEDRYGWRGWIQMRIEWLQYTVTDLLTDADKPGSLASAARAASPRPILLIAAGEVADELDAAEHIGAATDNVTVWAVADAGHVQGIAVAPGDWENRVVGFLDSALGEG